MSNFLRKTAAAWRQFAIGLPLRRDSAPIASIDGLASFVATRSAFIAQKTLYGYVKTRMGTRYPAMFADDVFVTSLNIAKLHIFAACLSDLTVYAVAHALADESLPDDTRFEVALACFNQGLINNRDQIVPGFSAARAATEFVSRLEGTDWKFGARQRENFRRSPLALVRWAPIAPELKRFDAEIVENSIRFAWRDVRVQFQRRLDADAIAADLRQQGSSQPP